VTVSDNVKHCLTSAYARVLLSDKLQCFLKALQWPCDSAETIFIGRDQNLVVGECSGLVHQWSVNYTSQLPFIIPSSVDINGRL